MTSPVRRVNSRIRDPLRRLLARSARCDWVLAAAAAASVAARLLTYDSFADGTWRGHVSTTVFGLVVTAMVWALVRTLLWPRTALPAVAALFVLLAGDSVHLARWAHPLTREGREVLLNEEAPWGRLKPNVWLLKTSGDGDARVRDGQLVLRNGPGSSAYADLNLAPPRRAFPGSRLIPQDAFAPVAYRGWLTRKVTWSAAVHLDGRYYAVVEIVSRQVLIQAVPWGLLISYRGDGGEMTSRSVDVPEASRTSDLTWIIEQSPARLAVHLGDSLLWEGPAGAPLDFVRFGDGRPDSAHGGSMEISRVQYILDRPGAG